MASFSAAALKTRQVEEETIDTKGAVASRVDCSQVEGRGAEEEEVP